MRALGSKSSLAAFRWDLVYLVAQIEGDDREAVAALAPSARMLLTKAREQRAAYEEAEEVEIAATSRLHKCDVRRDEVLVQLGGIARAVDKDAYAAMFPKQSPARIAHMAIDDETLQMNRVLAELRALPQTHILRREYEQPLSKAEADLEAAVTTLDKARVALARERTLVEQFKTHADEERLHIHGSLLTILKDKAKADSFFRPTTQAPDEKKADAGDTGDAKTTTDGKTTAVSDGKSAGASASDREASLGEGAKGMTEQATSGK